jgi:competence protein ComEC
MTVLHANGNVSDDFNDASVVVRLDLGTRHVLLPGDAQGGERRPPTDPAAPGSVERDLLDNHAADLPADILVAGHHGSKTSSRTAFLDAIHATQYVVSAGPTKYQTVVLPDREVVNELARRGTVWRTDLNDGQCKTNPRKIGRDADGKAGGCDNIVIMIGSGGEVNAAYYRPAD